MRSKWAWVAVAVGLALSAQAASPRIENVAAAGGGDIVATAKWDAPGADIDLQVLGPDQKTYSALEDQRTGPATETVVIRNPPPGAYKVGVLWQDFKPNARVPVTVTVKQGNTDLGTFQAVLGARPNDVKVVSTVNVGQGPAPAPAGPGTAGPGAADPGFVGTWIEYWPGINIHDINVITFQNGTYTVQTTNPQTGPYRIDNVKFEGGVLRFTQYPDANTPLQYELRVQDANTLGVRATGGQAGGDQIIWRRDTATGPIGPAPAPGPAGGADLVTSLKWETPGADVDLNVIGPNNQIFKPAQDVATGPGEEICTIRGAAPGDYKIMAVYSDAKGGPQAPITAEVRLGDKVLTTKRDVLAREGDVKLVATVTVPGAGPGTAAGPGADPGFAGTWIEFWPNVGIHDINVITFQGGKYTVQTTNPRTGPYRIDNVRFEGGVLRFTQYPGGVPLQYELRLQDANTINARAMGGAPGGDRIVWRRQGTQPPGHF